MAKCCGVNRLWHSHAGAEGVWQSLVFENKNMIIVNTI